MFHVSNVPYQRTWKHWLLIFWVLDIFLIWKFSNTSLQKRLFKRSIDFEVSCYARNSKIQRQGIVSTGKIQRKNLKLDTRQRRITLHKYGKELTCQCSRCGFSPWVGKINWKRKSQTTPVLLPGKSHGERSLTTYGPWGHKIVRPT